MMNKKTYKEICEIFPKFQFRPINVGKDRVKECGQYTNQFSRSITYSSDEGPIPLEFTVNENDYVGNFDELWDNVTKWFEKNGE